MLKSIKVRDYMTRGLITLTPEMDLFEAIGILQTNKISGAPVIDENGHLLGMLSEGDCLRTVLHRGELLSRVENNKSRRKK